MTVRFFHCADVHLGSQLVGLAARDGDLAQHFVGATRRAFTNLVSRAIDEKVAFVLIAGDLFDDDWKDYATGQFFIREVARLARAAIRVVLIKGNHDATSVVSKNLPVPENVTVLSSKHPETVELSEQGVAIHGQSFPNREVPESIVHHYPSPKPRLFNIGLLHTSLTGRGLHATYAPCSVDDLRARGYDYWALGHVHAREVVDAGAAIVFPGNLQGRHARETGPKGATLVEIEAGRIAGIEAVALDAARWATSSIDLSGVERSSEVEARAQAEIQRAWDAADGRPLALRLTLTGGTRLHDEIAAARRRLVEELQAVASRVSDEIMLEKLKVETKPPSVGVSGSTVGRGELAEALDAASHSSALLEGVASDLDSVVTKLPAEVAAVPDWTPPAQRIAEILEAARSLILGRLHDDAPRGGPVSGGQP